MHRTHLRYSVFTLALLVASTSAGAQSDRAARFMDNCQRGGGDEERFCETRTVNVAASGALSVDGRTNGGISVHGMGPRRHSGARDDPGKREQ
jgi:hypothetical protein